MYTILITARFWFYLILILIAKSNTKLDRFSLCYSVNVFIINNFPDSHEEIGTAIFDGAHELLIWATFGCYVILVIAILKGKAWLH